MLLAKEDAEGKQVTYTYTTGGKLETRTWARLDAGNPLTTTYTYHPQTGELESIDYSDTTPDISFTYDRLGQPETITDAVGTRTFTYNDYNQLETESITGLYNETITRTYEQTGVPGRSSGFNLGPDYEIQYGYDTSGRFENVSWNVNGTNNSATYTYHPKADLITGMTVTGTAADYTATYTYHPKRNLKQRVENKYGSTLISSYYSPVDELGRRNATITSGTAFITNPIAFNLYDYNARSELIESSRYEGTDITDLTAPITDEYRQYIFDNIGNREESTEAAETGLYNTNSFNQYTDLTKGPETEAFTHDDDGNLISRTTGGKTIQYTFNGENRLIAIEPQTPESVDVKVTMRYDYMGRRVEKKAYSYTGTEWTEQYTKHFFYDGWNLVKETTTENITTTATYYTWGLDLSQFLQGAGGIGGLIATMTDSETNYHCYDLNGNKTQLIAEADGAIAAHIEYDPFGNDINSYGLLSENDPFRFSTKYNDPEYDLYYYGYRYYLPDLGRWLTRDPIGEEGGQNSYLAMKNNIPNIVDAWGLEFIRLITHTTSIKKSDEYTFANAANRLKNEYEQKGDSKIITAKVSSGHEIIELINDQEKDSIISLDIISHSNFGGIHIASKLNTPVKSPWIKSKLHNLIRDDQSKQDAEYMEESFNGLYVDKITAHSIGIWFNQLPSAGISYLSQIDYSKFSNSSKVEFHGCLTAEEIKVWKLQIENFAQIFSILLYKSGKLNATVTGHTDRSSPSSAVTLLAQWHKNSFPLRSRWQSPAFSSFSCYFFIQNGLFSHLMVLNTQYIDWYVPCNYKGRL